MKNIKLMVCPHDTASNPDKWYHFAHYLTKSLSSSVMFEKSMDFPDFHEELTSGGLIYANPQDSLRLIKEHDYTPVVHSSNLFDEIVFVASKDIENPQLSDLSGSEVISVNSMLVTRVGIKHLNDKNIQPATIKSATSWMAVIKAVFRKEAKYALVYKDFYEGLNSLSKSGLQKFDETQDGTIHHNLLVSPELKNIAGELQKCLIEMNEQGENSLKILESLGIEKFLPVSKDKILAFETLSHLGNELMEQSKG